MNRVVVRNLALLMGICLVVVFAAACGSGAAAPVATPPSIAEAPTAAPTDTPAPTATNSPTPTPTDTPTPTETPTPMPTPTLPEIPYEVKDGIVYKYIVTENNQLELVPDESFPYDAFERLYSQTYERVRLQDKVNQEDTRLGPVLTIRDANYGFDYDQPGTLRAIKLPGGEWQAANEFNIKEILPAPNIESVTAINMPEGYTLNAEAANYVWRYVLETMIVRTPEYFQAVFGTTDTERVIAELRSNGYQLPKAPEGVPDKGMPVGKSNYYVDFNSPRTQFESNITFDTIYFYIDDGLPDGMRNFTALEEALRASMNTSRLIITATGVGTGRNYEIPHNHKLTTGITFVENRLALFSGVLPLQESIYDFVQSTHKPETELKRRVRESPQYMHNSALSTFLQSARNTKKHLSMPWILTVFISNPGVTDAGYICIDISSNYYQTLPELELILPSP
ncbi:MAG: hypothetical protein H3C69_09175 [Candidatus Promineofilum sp.]|nr:hypothetical protein [Promineifilum sp.]